MKTWTLHLGLSAILGSMAIAACGDEGGDDGGTADGGAGEASGGSAGKGGTGSSGSSGSGTSGDAGQAGGGSGGTDGGTSGTAGTAGAAGTAGGAGAPSTEGLDDAVAICAWTTGCLNTEDNAGGAAPNTSMSPCLATFVSEHAGNARFPWADARDCLAEE